VTSFDLFVFAHEDCQFGAQPGRRREGIIFGALNMIQNFSGSFLSSVVFIGLGVAGLKTRNCTFECEGIEELEGGDCADTCFTNVILSQPDSLRLFVRLVIGFWAPFCELMVAYHSWRFPIKGARLRKLTNSMRQSRGEDISADNEIAVVAGGGRGRADQIAAHCASSKANLRLGHNQDSNTEDWMTKLTHTIAFAESRPAPKSMAVFFEWSDTLGSPASKTEPVSPPDANCKDGLMITLPNGQQSPSDDGQQSPSTVPPEAAHVAEVVSI